MKLERIPIFGAEAGVSELSELDLFEYYDGFLAQLEELRRLFVRTQEIPEIVVQAAAFRLGCTDHETGAFGWCPWEVNDPAIFATLRRFVEKTGQHDLAKEVLNFEEKLAKFSVEDARHFFGNQHAELSAATRDGINDVVARGFDHAKFGEDIWIKTARVGADLVADAKIFEHHHDFESLRLARYALVDALPDYENRIQEKTMWRVPLPFHALLTGVGERYYHDERVKLTRDNGCLSLSRDAHKYQELAVFDDASQVYLVTSTKRLWLCCQVGETAWLVDPTTGEKRVSAPVSP